MTSGFAQEGPGSIPDVTKDPPSKCGVSARKIRGSERPVVGRQQFTMGVIFLPCQRYIKIGEMEMDITAIDHQEAEIGTLQNGPLFSEIMYSSASNPVWGSVSQMAHDNANNIDCISSSQIR